MFDLFKRTKSEVIADNRRNGRAFEDERDDEHKIMGRDVKKLRKGPDRKITETDWLTGKKRTWYEEYKSSSTAPLRPSQKEFMKKHPGKMRVIRPSEPFGFEDESFKPKRPRSKKKKKQSRSENYGFNMDNVFGSGKNSDWGWL